MFEKMKKALEDTLNKNSLILVSDRPEEIENTDADLSFVVWGDPQISRLSPFRAARVYYAVEDLNLYDGNFDALVITGDLTEYGRHDEYQMLSYLLEPVLGKFANIFAVPGNHDVRLRNYRKQLKKFSGFLAGLKNGVPNPEDRYYFSKEVKGYKFIMMGSDRSSFEASYISQKQLDWLDSELKTSDPAKPVFIFNHQPLKKTNGLPVTFLGRGKWRGTVGWESDKLRAVFEKYYNVVYITGHLHYCTSEYTFEDCGHFYAVNAPTVGVVNHGHYKKYSQGLIFNVFNDTIEVRSRVFGERIYTPGNISNSSFTIKPTTKESDL